MSPVGYPTLRKRRWEGKIKSRNFHDNALPTAPRKKKRTTILANVYFVKDVLVAIQKSLIF